MSVKLIESVVDFVNDYLEENLPAKLDELDIEYDDFVLEDIKKFYIAELAAIPEYPSLVTLGDETNPTGESGDWIRARHSIAVICFTTDADTERLRRRLYRYARAIFELISASQGTTGTYVLSVDRLAFSSVYTKGSGQFIADAHLELAVTSLETF